MGEFGLIAEEVYRSLEPNLFTSYINIGRIGGLYSNVCNCDSLTTFANSFVSGLKPSNILNVAYLSIRVPGRILRVEAALSQLYIIGI